MQKALYLILVFILNITFLKAQPSEDAKVTEVINRLFSGMYNADSTMVRSVFAKDVTMATAFHDKEGVPVLRRENSINDFVKQVGKKPAEPYAEEIWNLKIQIDGEFAQVWCDYAFYIGNKFNHCGVDAFQLYKYKEGWKIFHLADTRRKEGCNVPDDIQKKHK